MKKVHTKYNIESLLKVALMVDYLNWDGRITNLGCFDRGEAETSAK